MWLEPLKWKKKSLTDVFWKCSILVSSMSMTCNFQLSMTPFFRTGPQASALVETELLGKDWLSPHPSYPTVLSTWPGWLTNEKHMINNPNAIIDQVQKSLNPWSLQIGLRHVQSVIVARVLIVGMMDLNITLPREGSEIVHLMHLPNRRVPPIKSVRIITRTPPR